MKSFRVRQLRRIAVGTVAIAALAGGSVQAAKPKPIACPTIITACGCTIAQPDFYTVANDLTASQTSAPNCIEITAAGAILNVEGHKILGNGTGIGILVHQSAVGAIVEGGEESSNVPPQNPLGNPPESPTQGKVNLWDVGIEDDANGAVIALFADIGGSLLQSASTTVEPTGNTTGRRVPQWRQRQLRRQLQRQLQWQVRCDRQEQQRPDTRRLQRLQEQGHRPQARIIQSQFDWPGGRVFQHQLRDDDPHLVVAQHYPRQQR